MWAKQMLQDKIVRRQCPEVCTSTSFDLTDDITVVLFPRQEETVFRTLGGEAWDKKRRGSDLPRPCEIATQPTDRRQPIKDRTARDARAHVREQPHHRGHGHRDEGPPLAVNVPQNAGRLLLLRQRGEHARAPEKGTVGHGKDRDEDHGIHDRVEPRQAGVLDGDDEGRGGGVGAGAAEAGVVGADDEAYYEDGEDVELVRVEGVSQRARWEHWLANVGLVVI